MGVVCGRCSYLCAALLGGRDEGLAVSLGRLANATRRGMVLGFAAALLASAAATAAPTRPGAVDGGTGAVLSARVAGPSTPSRHVEATTVVMGEPVAGGTSGLAVAAGQLPPVWPACPANTNTTLNDPLFVAPQCTGQQLGVLGAPNPPSMIQMNERFTYGWKDHLCPVTGTAVLPCRGSWRAIGVGLVYRNEAQDSHYVTGTLNGNDYPGTEYGRADDGLTVLGGNPPPNAIYVVINFISTVVLQTTPYLKVQYPWATVMVPIVGNGAGMVLDWSMVDRFDGTSKTLVKTADDANPSSWRFKVSVTSGCSGGDVIVLRADGKDVNALPTGFCAWEFDRTDLKPFTLEAAKVQSAVVVDTAATTVAGRDFLVMSIGDSLSSGEGAPQEGAERWTDARCDRSMLSGAAQAALLLEKSDPHSTVSFVHLACSGATSDAGLMGSFGGVAPDGGIEPAQIAAMATIARGREIDAVTMSIGANDVEFGDVIKHCIFAGVIRISSRTADPPFVIPDCFDPSMPLKGQPLEQFVTTRLAQMPTHAAQIASWFDQVGVAANRVFSYDYPDGTRDQNGAFCGTQLTSPMNQAEWEWAYTHIAKPLNDGVGTTAAAQGWNYVGGFGPLFAQHGYCSTDPWVQTLPGSVWAQVAVNGAFHPNALGYQKYAAIVFDALKASLFPGGIARPARTTQGLSTTLTSGSTAAGATEIPVQFDHFKIGDHVIVGLGTLMAEPATITGKGSLIFSAPLNYAHAAGETIVLAGALNNALPVTATPLGFYALPPVRVVDTRLGQGQGAVPVLQHKYGGGTILRVLIAGSAGVPPSDAGAVSLNVTVVDPDGAGYVTVFPCGDTPLASNLNFVAGQTVPNAVIAPISPDGYICLYASVNTHLVADVNGWFPTGSGFNSVTPTRVFDTRPDQPQGAVPVVQQRYSGANILKVKVAGVAGVPASGAGAVSLNVTAVDPDGAGYVTVFPCGDQPLASNLNFVAHQTVPNAVIARLSADGYICFFAQVGTHLIADVNGWFATGAGYNAVAPVRAFDTRPEQPQGVVPVVQQKYGGVTVLKVKVAGVAGVPASGASAVSLNVTAVDPDGAGYVTVFPCGDQPLASNLNFVAHQTVPNAVIAPLSTDGYMCLYAQVGTHLVADINGWFAG
ncbi:MAG: hypothetical protein JWN62_84 [Acidimicrobiales bacterium]|nr:hypothetical protein [Acidimicrobiales bacterium]